MATSEFASRAGAKLDFALQEFNISPTSLICADLGCSTGGFTSCLLSHGATKVYAVDTGYGVLDWHLRNNPQVVVMERTNALHVQLPEPINLITIDVSWTPQRLILPHAISLLAPGGKIISLIKPHYEAHIAKLSADQAKIAAENTVMELEKLGYKISKFVQSPILGGKGANTEFLMLYSI